MIWIVLSKRTPGSAKYRTAPDAMRRAANKRVRHNLTCGPNCPSADPDAGPLREVGTKVISTGLADRLKASERLLTRQSPSVARLVHCCAIQVKWVAFVHAIAKVRFHLEKLR